MKRNLSDRLLQSLTKPGEPVEVWDQNLRGFGVRSQRRGGAAFFVMRRVRGSGRPQAARITLGEYGPLTLAEARDRARLLLRDLYDGVDPRERAAEQRRLASIKAANSFEAVAEEFIRLHVAKKRTSRSIELRIRRELIPRWRGRPIVDVTRGDVLSMVDEIVATGHLGAARVTLAYTKRLFGWALSRDYGIASNPCDGISAKDLIGARSIRQRILTDVELGLVWRAAGDTTEGTFIKMLALLGQRRSQVSKARWSEIDLDRALWVVPAERGKFDEPHAVPLSARALELLNGLQRFAASDFAFSVKGERPLSGFSAIKERLDMRVTALNSGIALDHWTLHDLRRTCRTGLSSLGVRPDIAEMCISHQQPGIRKVYDLHRFETEKRQAMEKWAAHLDRIVNPLADNVVAMPA